MRLQIALAAMTLISGCATTSGAIPLGPDTYMITREAGSGFAGTTSTRNDALKEAGAYCQKAGRQLRVVSMAERRGGPFVYPRADVSFMCLKEGDPQLTRPDLALDPVSVIQVQSK